MAHVTVDGCPTGQGSEQNVAGRRARAPSSVSGLVVPDTPQGAEVPIASGKEPRADADPARNRFPPEARLRLRTERTERLPGRPYEVTPPRRWRGSRGRYRCRRSACMPERPPQLTVEDQIDDTITGAM
jgi:hypothetical protein